MNRSRVRRFAAVICAALFATSAPTAFAQVIQWNPADPTSAEEPDLESLEVAADEFDLPVDERTAARIESLLHDLRSPIERERRAAHESLVSIGATAFSRLRDEYNTSTDLDVKTHIEQITYISYIIHHALRGVGFLGIQRQARFPFPTHDDDPRIPEGHAGLKLGLVLPNTGAERAGLEVDDIITHLNDEPLGGDVTQPFNWFSEQIRGLGPGAQIKLSVLRGMEQFDVVATLGPVPRDRFQTVNGIGPDVIEAQRNFQVWWDRYFEGWSPQDQSAAQAP